MENGGFENSFQVASGKLKASEPTAALVDDSKAGGD